jgi:hypothetical protein
VSDKPSDALNVHEPVRRRLGNFVPLDYDAHLTLDGRVWHRVHMGLGHRGDREDWVLDAPDFSVIVSRYENSEHWGWDRLANTSSREEAMRSEVERARRDIIARIAEAEEKLLTLREAQAILQREDTRL